MGAKFSPSLANLYLGWWERSHIFACDSPRRMDTLFYCRYIDDLLFVVSEKAGSLDEWLTYLNDNDLNLKFTGNSSFTSINYLDIHLEGKNGKVTTNIFRKPTTGNTLLRADSSHPKHTLKAIRVGEFLRLKRICSEDRDYKHKVEIMFKRFKDRP